MQDGNKNMLSFQDKIKPVSTTAPAVSSSGLSFADKIKPLAKPMTAEKVDNGSLADTEWSKASPIIKNLNEFGAGLGTNIAKAGLGLGKTFFKGANAISNVATDIGLSDAPKDQYNPVISNIDKIKKNIYEDPFKKENSSISGKAGNFAGDIAQFTLPSAEISKATQVGTGLYKSTILSKMLTDSGLLGKAADYGIKAIIPALSEGIGTAATFYGTTGGDKKEALTAGIGAGIFSGLTHVGSDAIGAIIPKSVTENVSRVFGYAGKKSLSEAASGGFVDKAVGAFKTISKLAPELKVTDVNGVEKTFIPSKATFMELPQVLAQAKDIIYNAYTDLAKKAGELGGQFTAKDFYAVIDDLNKYDGKGYTPAFSSKANQIKSALARYVVDGINGIKYYGNTLPEEIQTLIQNINRDVNPLSDRAGSDVAQNASQKLRQLMDDKITQATGDARYQKFRDAYSQLKSIESDVINKWKVAMRKSGVKPGLIDGISTIDGLVGIMRMDPIEMARAGLTQIIKKTFNYLRDPEVNLQRAFRLLEKEPTLPVSKSPLNERFAGSYSENDAITPSKIEKATLPTKTPAATDKNIINQSIPRNEGKVKLGTVIGTTAAATAGSVILGNTSNRIGYEAPVSSLPMPKTSVIDGIDIKKYATDPNHESAVKTIHKSIPEMATSTDAQSYIDSKFPDSPITGDMIIEASTTYGVSPKLILAIMQQDSGLGTKGLGAKTRNPGNVGNNDKGQIIRYKSWREGVLGVARFLSKYKVNGSK